MKLLDEESIRQFYRLLDHKGDTELRFLKRDSYPTYKIVDNEEDFVKECKKWNGRHDIYAGFRSRASNLKGCARAEDIIGIQILTLDIDPIRATNTLSTKREVSNTIKVSEIVSDWFAAKGYKRPCRAVTGNGVCLYFSLPWYEITEKNRWEITRRLESFEASMRKIFKVPLKEHNCCIDSMYDLPRIGRVIGTLNLKGQRKKSTGRISYWLEVPRRMPDSKLMNTILEGNIETEDKPGSHPVWLMQPIPYFGEDLKGEWIIEPKIDGWRMQIIKWDKRVEFWGRRLEKNPNWTEKLSIIPVSSLKKIPDKTIIDAELTSDRGRRFIPSLFAVSPKAKPIVWIFDIVYYKGEFIGGYTLRDRKKILKSLKIEDPIYLLDYKKLKNLEQHLKEAVENKYEGIVLKKWSSKYLLGKECPMASSNWRKIKP